MKRLISVFFICLMIFSLTACKKTPKASKEKNSYPSENDTMYVTDSQKAEWYAPLVKLISNQEEAYGNPADVILGYKPPPPDEPSIASGYRMGLFDVDLNGVPELMLDLGGGSAGNSYYYVYDIFSGERIGVVNGGGNEAWALYYDVKNEYYKNIGRYDWRVGDSGSVHYITTVCYNEEEKGYCEKYLFCSSYAYDKKQMLDENGEPNGMDLELADVSFSVDGEPEDFQEYHYALTEFYQEHSLVPHTGIKLFTWRDVSDNTDTYQARAEKMANRLLYSSGQKFLNVNN